MTQATEPKRRKNVPRLKSLGDVLREQGKVYREMRRGEMAKSDGNSLIYALGQIRATVEAHVIEPRMAAIEEAMSAQAAVNGRAAPRLTWSR